MFKDFWVVVWVEDLYCLIDVDVCWVMDDVVVVLCVVGVYVVE